MNIHVEVWLAAASLHEAGRPLLTPAEIKAEVQRLFGDERPGVQTHIIAHVNASANATPHYVHNYLTRVDRGTYRLCRVDDPVHPSRTGAPLYPDQSEVDEPHWPLWRKWTAWQKGATAQVAAAAMPSPPTTGSAPEQVAAYVRNLDGFRLERSPAGNYNHMGATITEAILQAGIDYRSVVVPRVTKLRESYAHLRTTSQFANLLALRHTEDIIDFTGAKPRRVESLTYFLQQEHVETEADLRAWLGNAKNRDRLQDLPGVGPKTVDYLQILVGIDNSAVDRHLALFLEEAGVQATTYQRRKEIIEQAAAVLGVDKAVLDYSIWLYMSDRSRTASPPVADRPWYWEGRIQARLVDHLKRQGYTIIRTADTASREAGKDIIARGADGRLLWVSVKGFPEKSASVQARHWFAGAVFDLLLYRGENADVDLALGLPDGYQTYQGLTKRIEWLRRQMPFAVYWVASPGQYGKTEALSRSTRTPLEVHSNSTRTLVDLSPTLPRPYRGAPCGPFGHRGRPLLSTRPPPSRAPTPAQEPTAEPLPGPPAFR